MYSALLSGRIMEISERVGDRGEGRPEGLAAGVDSMGRAELYCIVGTAHGSQVCGGSERQQASLILFWGAAKQKKKKKRMEGLGEGRKE